LTLKQLPSLLATSPRSPSGRDRGWSLQSRTV